MPADPSGENPGPHPAPVSATGVRSRLVSGCWTAFFVSVGVGTLLLVLLFFVMPAWIMSGWFQEGAYVSDRPDLTYNTEKHLAKGIHDQLNGFLQAHGLSVKDARDVRIASGTHYKHGLLFTFKLSSRQRKRLVRGMKRSPDPARHFTGPGADERGMAGALLGTTGVVRRAELQYLRAKEPFNRLKWWPPRAAELNRMTVYEGPIQWHQSEISPSTCFIFISRQSDTVYVAADGA